MRPVQRSQCAGKCTDAKVRTNGERDDLLAAVREHEAAVTMTSAKDWRLADRRNMPATVACRCIGATAMPTIISVRYHTID